LEACTPSLRSRPETTCRSPRSTPGSAATRSAAATAPTSPAASSTPSTSPSARPAAPATPSRRTPRTGAATPAPASAASRRRTDMPNRDVTDADGRQLLVGQQTSDGRIVDISDEDLNSSGTATVVYLTLADGARIRAVYSWMADAYVTDEIE